MNTLTIVFTGLVFYATPQGSQFTNAVLVAGDDPKHHHTASLVLPEDGSVTVTKGGVPTDVRRWSLGPSSWIVVTEGDKAPGRSDAFRGHVPSLGQALLSTFPDQPEKRGVLHPCTYATQTTDSCAHQQGRVQLSGGELNAKIPSPDPLYDFVARSLESKYSSRLTHETSWTSRAGVKSFVLHHKGDMFIITLNRAAVVRVSNEPSNETGRHIGLMRLLYGLYNNGSDEDFPVPISDRAALLAFRSLAAERGFPKTWFAELFRVSNPVLCPPATQ